MSSLVSIITPVYNAENYIRDTIESVRNQNYDNWELIIVDDCSTDNSKQIVKEYVDKDNRIKLISLEKNQGVANARNLGIENAVGDYIAFLDSDDMWHSNKLLKQVHFMKENNCLFSFTKYELIDDEGNKLNKEIEVPPIVNYKQLLKGNVIGCLTVMIDRKIIQKMPDIGHEDYATWLNILKTGVSAHGINESLALYRRTVNSLSSNKFKALIWTWKIYRHNQQMNLFESLRYFISYILKTSKKYIYILKS